MLYGGFVRTFNDPANAARALIADYFKGINTMDFVDAYQNVTINKDDKNE